MKCAKENAVPRWAASAALASLEPRSHTSGTVGPLGIAVTFAYGCPSGKLARRKPMASATCCGNAAAALLRPVLHSLATPSPRSPNARAVTGSLPGARPMPRSMRPGKSVSSTRKVSATFKGL